MQKPAPQQFHYDLDTLKTMSQDMLQIATTQGASAAEVDVSVSVGQSVSVRMGDTENIEYNRDKGLSVTVYFGQKKGHASTSDLSPNAMRDTVLAACDIAKYTAQDPFCGLADAELLAKEIPDCDLYHPQTIEVADALEMAKVCEAAARDVDARIKNSDGASLSSGAGQFVYANTNGFNAGYAYSRYSLSCAVIAEDNGEMQRDYWYDSARDFADLASGTAIGLKTGQRTVRRLNPQKIQTCQVPVLFNSSLSAGLIRSLVRAVSGSSLYRKQSFLLDSLGTQVAASNLTIVEDPLIKKGLGSSPFDNEGVQTKLRTLVDQGVLQGYLLGSYSARKLGMQSTGNAGGSHNLLVQSGDQDFEGLLKQMDKGLLVTELLGHGLNMVTGDYSRGAAGFWVENGEIQHPVEGITIAGNLKEMLNQIVAIGNDVHISGGVRVGSILIEQMTVASE